MAELAGRLYVPKTYLIDSSRSASVELLERAIKESRARLIYSSFREEQVAPVYLAAEDKMGRRYGLLVYPFTATRREIRNRPKDERRAQIRFGDPTRAREESNRIARDCAGVDVTMVLAVEPEANFIVGLDPLIYEDLPMGISVYYRDEHVAAARETGWAVWSRTKKGGRRRPSWEGLETLVGFHPRRLLDYARFEAQASGLALSPELRHRLADDFASSWKKEHRLETLFGLESEVILDIIDSNFRLGVAMRGGVAEHHLGVVLRNDPAIAKFSTLDEDGRPDYAITLTDGTEMLVECKTAAKDAYANGDFKVEIQKTRDSAAGRKYKYGHFDVVAACLFPATGLWEFRWQWARKLAPWSQDPGRIRALHRVDSSWAGSLHELLALKNE